MGRLRPGARLGFRPTKLSSTPRSASSAARAGGRLLPDEFTLGQLQNLYETALGKTFDKRNFRKKLFKTTPLSTSKESMARPSSRQLCALLLQQGQVPEDEDPGLRLLF